MQPNIIFSLFYALASIALLGGFLLIKKVEGPLKFGAWMPISCLMLLCYQTFVAALLSIVHIPVNLIGIGCLNAMLAIFLWVKLRKSGKKQAYVIERIDIVYFLVLVVVIAFIIVRRFGISIAINFNSIDGAPHMANAIIFTKTGKLDPMYHASLNHGLFIQMLSPFCKVVNYYKLYIISEMIQLALAGACFYALVRKYMKDIFLKVAGVIGSMLYVLGYPLNSTLFGFAYLGMCITVVIGVLFVADAHQNKELNQNVTYILLMLCCYAVFESYVMFVPAVYLAVGVWILAIQRSKGKIWSIDTLLSGIKVFLCPIVFGFYFVYRGFFGSGSELTVTNQAMKEGGIYRNLYSNYLIILPLAIFGIIALIKNKKNCMLIIMAVSEILCMAGMFVLAMGQKISGYYFYKNPFLLWLILFALAFFAICEFEKQARQFLSIGFVIWFCALMSMLVNVRSKIWQINTHMVDDVENLPAVDIYVKNNGYMVSPNYPEDKVLLYQYVKENIYDKNLATDVPLIGYYEDAHWKDVICMEHSSKYGADTILSMIDSGEVSYVVVLTDSEEYKEIEDALEGTDILYENGWGYVAHIVR